MEKKYLDEETYQRTNKKIGSVGKIIGFIVLIIGLSLIGYGVYQIMQNNEKHNSENIDKLIENVEKEKTEVQNRLNEEKDILKQEKIELNNKIEPIEDEITRLGRVQFDGFTDEYYERQDKIEELNNNIKKDKESIKNIDYALDDSVFTCAFDQLVNDNATENYCAISKELSTLDDEIKNLNSEFGIEFEKKSESNRYMIFIIPGIFLTVLGGMIFLWTFMITKRRKIAAYGVQQMMPIAQEGLEKVGPSLGKVAKDIKDNLK